MTGSICTSFRFGLVSVIFFMLTLFFFTGLVELTEYNGLMMSGHTTLVRTNGLSWSVSDLFPRLEKDMRQLS